MSETEAPLSIPALPLSTRIGLTLQRRFRYGWVRLRYPKAHFGPKCTIRIRFWLRMFPGAKVWFDEDCVLDRDMTVECCGSLRVGKRVCIGHHCSIGVVDSVEIGDDCLIADLVDIRDHDHAFDRVDLPMSQQGLVSAPVKIGNNVWLAAKVTVTKGVTIGDNAIIGANAVVTKDIPANAIAVGVPAKVIRFRETPKGREG